MRRTCLSRCLCRRTNSAPPAFSRTSPSRNPASVTARVSAWLFCLFAPWLPHAAAQSYSFTAVTSFYSPSGIAADSAGNLYVSTYYGATIYRLAPNSASVVLAGSGAVGGIDGTGSAARFSNPRGMAVDANGNVYVADSGNHAIRKITPAGVVTTVAGLAGSRGWEDGTGDVARFENPQGVAVDASGNLFVADTGTRTIRKITPAGVVTTFAGLGYVTGTADGAGLAARFDQPQGIAVDGSGNVYVADTNNHAIRKITPAGVTTTYAGWTGNRGNADGTGINARFDSPQGIAVDGSGTIFVADTGNFTIRRIMPGGVVTTIGGLAGFSGESTGLGAAARFGYPRGVAAGPNGAVFIADSTYVKQGTPSNQLAITVQPQSQSVASGSSTVLTVTATGATPFTYQWQKDGTPIPGATNATLPLAAVEAATTGSYTVTVTNSVGTLTSTAATITVLSPLGNDNFANAQVITGAAGSAAGNDNGATGEPGEPTHVTAAGTASSVWFRWTAPASGTVVIDLSPYPTVGAIYTGSSLGSLTRVVQGTSRLSFVAVADTTYQIAIGSNLSSNRGNFSFNWRMIPNDAFAQALELSGNNGELAGNNNGATGEPGEPVHINGSSANSTSVWFKWTPTLSGTAVFQARTTTFVPAVIAYSGSALNSLSRLAAVTGTNAEAAFVVTAGRTYYVVVGSHNYGGGPFTLVWRVQETPYVLGTAGMTTLAVGGSTTLSVNVASFLPLTYVWTHNGTPIPGATSPTLVLTNVQPADSGNYSVTTSNSAGVTATSFGNLTVLVPPANDNFANAQVLSGLSGSVTGSNINATGEPDEPAHWNASGAASSVWYRWTPATSGLAVIDTVGSTFDTVLAVYTGPGLGALTRIVQDDDRGGGRTSQVTFAATGGTTYFIAVGGSTSSARGNLTLGWQLSPNVAITAAPIGQTVSVGGSATFSVQATGAGLTYQWYRNGVAIPGATRSTLTIGSVESGSDASYTVAVSNGATTVTSAPATLAVAAPPSTALALRRARADGDLLWSIAAGGGQLVTVGSFGVILSSSDNGVTWTPRESGTNGWLVAVTYGGGQFVIVGEAGTILTSPDGRTWTRATYSGTTERLNGVVYADGKYVAVGEHGAAVTSSDGRLWTTRSTPVRTWLHGIAYHPGIRQFATVGENAVVLVSPDGVAWTKLDVPGFTRALQQVVAVDSYANFVAVGEEGMVVSIRQNDFVDKTGQPFTTWTADTHPTGSNTHYIGLAQGAGALFAMGYDGKVITATSDRGPWSIVPSGTSKLLLAGMFYGDTLYAVGENETVLQSDRLFSSRLVNISTRGQVGTGADLMISGFVVTGDRPKQVLVRAAGPTLASTFGLTGTLSAPVLTIKDSGNQTVATNTGWSTAANANTIATTAARVGAFPFGATSADSAILITLTPGAYTALISGANNGTGLSIVEVYDADALSNEGARAINISTRGVAGTGANKIIAGFVIDGASAQRVMIRAVGPSLGSFGLSGTLAEPQIELYNARGFLHATGAAWGLQPNADEIRGSAKTVKAFDLPEGSKDAAMVVTLAPGAWTVQVGGTGSASGLVLVEVYALP